MHLSIPCQWLSVHLHDESIEVWEKNNPAETFVWMGKFKNIVSAMNKTHHLFYIHRMVRCRNMYTEKCYKFGKKKILPKITNTGNFSPQ